MEAVFILRGGHPIRLRFCASRHQASPTASCAELPGRGRSRHSRAVLGDNDLPAGFHLLQQFGQVRLCFVRADSIANPLYGQEYLPE
jgi:hypothetical protein